MSRKHLYPEHVRDAVVRAVKAGATIKAAAVLHGVIPATAGHWVRHLPRLRMGLKGRRPRDPHAIALYRCEGCDILKDRHAFSGSARRNYCTLCALVVGSKENDNAD